MADVRTVTSSDGTRVGAEIVGSGPALVAIHGGTADRTRWAPVRDALAEHFTLYLVDRRGRGASTQEAEEYALDREVEDALTVCEAAGGAVRLLGHSYGGLIGLETLRRSPEAVGRALLYEPAFDTPGLHVAPPEALAAVKSRLAEDDREGALVTFYETIIGIDPTPLKSLPIWQARLAAAHTMVREGEIGLTYVLDPASFAEVTVPTRILAGTTSPAPFAAAARAAADAVPDAELVWLEGHGHTMIDVDPPGFVEQVLDFLG